MRELKTLVLLQLKNKLDWSFLNSKKQTIFKVIFAILKFIIITGIIYFAFFILSYLRLLSLLPGIPIKVMTVIFALLLVLSIIVCTRSLKNSLYMSLDNFMLLALPVSKSKIFLSKLCVYYLYELFRNIYYFLPFVFAYLLINNCPIYFYMWIIISLILYTLLVVTISALFSIPTLYLSNVIKSVKIIYVSLLIISIVLIVYLITKIILLIPENFDLMGNWGTTFWRIQEILDGFNSNLKIFYWLFAGMICDSKGSVNILFSTNQIVSLSIIIISIITIMIGIYYFVRPLFFKMASQNFEFKKNKNIVKRLNKKLSPFVSNIKKDLLLNFRISEKFNSYVVFSIAIPLSVLLLNKIYASMSTRLSGTYMSIAFNIMLILAMILSTNVSIAKKFSEESNASYLNKTNPQPYILSLTSKIILHGLVYSLSLLVSIIIFCSFINLSTVNSIIVYLLCESIYIGHLLYSAELDILNPQILEFATIGNHSYNKNETKSNLAAIILSALFTLLTYFFISENPDIVWVKLLLFAMIYLILRIYLYSSKIKIYYKEAL